MIKKVIITVFVLICLLSLNAFALNGNVDDLEAEGEKVTVYAGTSHEKEMVKVPGAKYMADTLWVLVAAFLVFFMQAGFAMVESGFTRAKNAVNILMKNLMDFSMWGPSLTGQSVLPLCSGPVTHSWAQVDGSFHLIPVYLVH